MKSSHLNVGSGRTRRVGSMIGCVGALLVSASAWATGYSIVGGVDYTHATIVGGPSGAVYSANAGATAGLLMDMGLAPLLEFESGLLYVGRNFHTVTPTQTYDTKYNSIMVPLMLRVHLLPMFSLGGGFYVAKGIGQVNTAGTNFSWSSVGFKPQAGLSGMDYGAIGSLQFALPLGAASLIADLRYVHGIAEQAHDTTSGNSIKNRDYEGLLGVRFDMK